MLQQNTGLPSVCPPSGRTFFLLSITNLVTFYLLVGIPFYLKQTL